MSLIDFTVPQFIKSAATIHQCPDDEGAEIAFVGRSNAGKSSALNALTNRKQLARTGSKPGRTRLLNFFSIGDELCRLVDLPGYGYAQVSKQERLRWHDMISSFLYLRSSLCAVCLIMDARHPLQKNDQDFIDLLMQRETVIPIVVLLNRVDKLSHNIAAQTLKNAKNNCALIYPDIHVSLFSAIKKIGVTDTRARITKLLEAQL